MDDYVDTGLGNSLVPLPESVLTKTCDAILLHWTATKTVTGVVKGFCETNCLVIIFLIASFS